MSKKISFANCAIGLSLSKIWHDTFRMFLSIYSPNCTRELLGNYLSTNASGLLIGGVLAGFLTDSLTPKITFPASMILIGLFSGILILLYQFSIVECYLNELIIFASLFVLLSFIYFSIYSIVKKTKLSTVVKKIIKPNLDPENCLSYLFLVLLIPAVYLLKTNLSLVGLDKFYQSFNAKQVFIFIRGFCIALGMNSAYVAVANLFKNDAFLATASNYLYMALFGALALIPISIEYLPKKPTFIALTLIMFLLGIVLWFYIPATEKADFSIRKYTESCRMLALKPDFIAACFVSMVCVGGFYNIVYIFTDASLNGGFTGNLSFLQSIGRQCTFGVLALIYLFNISFLKMNSKNCSQYMSFGMLCVGISCFVIYCCHTLLPATSLPLLAQIAFWATCLCTGFSQPAAKYAILSMAQKFGKNIAGAAQSFVTLSNSLIEQQGSRVILGTPYPFGSRIYILTLSIFCLLLAGYLYWRRKQINSYLKLDAVKAPSKENVTTL